MIQALEPDVVLLDVHHARRRRARGHPPAPRERDRRASGRPQFLALSVSDAARTSSP